MRNPARIVELPTGLHAQAVLGDLNDKQSLIEACADIDCVLHLAGMAHVGSSSQSPNLTTNIIGTENLLNAALEQKVNRIVFLSSSLAQAAESGTGDVTEYGRAKLAAEELLTAASSRGEIETVILRAVNVYGVGMKGNITNMIRMINSGRLPPLPALSSRISLLAVDDLVNALVLAATSAAAIAKTYTVTDSEVYPIASIEQSIYAALGKTQPRWRTPAVILYAASAMMGLLSRFLGREGSISARTYRNLTTDNLFDNEDICRDLGFTPTTTFYESLPEIVEHITTMKE